MVSTKLRAPNFSATGTAVNGNPSSGGHAATKVAIRSNTDPQVATHGFSCVCA